MKELKHYGLHRHFTGSGSVLMFGGGMKKGFLYGETAAERPLLTIEEPGHRSRDLHATIFTAMGISPKTAFDVEKRPFYATEDADSLADVAGRARVVITTVGPYLAYGEPLVAACAAAGTDYLDLTGEPEFVDRMYLAHHETAVGTGARIVHAAGFDSVPHDLGVLYTLQQLQARGPVTVRGVVRASATFSGGTFHSAMTAFSRARQTQAPSRRSAAGPSRRPEGRQVARGRRQAAQGPAPRLLAAPAARRSTRSSSPAAAPRSRRTARTSATPTTPGPRRCGTPPAAPRPRRRCS